MLMKRFNNNPSVYSFSAFTIMATLFIAGCNDKDNENIQTTTSALPGTTKINCVKIDSKPIRIDGGSFIIGSNAVYAEEGPETEISVNGFWIDPHEVSNAQFEAFATATQYITVAQKPVDPEQFGADIANIPADLLKAGSAVFIQPQNGTNAQSGQWQYLPGAYWKKPYGPGGPDAKPNEPVVHLTIVDMQAYADWKSGRLPTEAEWEYAALSNKNTQQPANDHANSWQGAFPAYNQASDGFIGIATSGCFTPNENGLYDMVGNVWELTADIYQPRHDERIAVNSGHENIAERANNQNIPFHVIKGGSFLCAPNYCQRYRAESRQPQDSGLGASHVGFRLVYDKAPQ